MNFYLLLLAPLTSAINSPPSFLPPSTDSNTTQPLPSLGVAYRCSTPGQHDFGRRMPSALDCLNIFTFILATTPNHDRPSQWSRNPAAGQTMLPYRRNSGSCQLFVSITRALPAPAVETATFDQIVGAAMRITESCLLDSRPDVEHWGGAALAGLGKHLDIVLWGTPIPGGSEAVPGNETAVLNDSGKWVNGVSQN